jgi:hypothetical protein
MAGKEVAAWADAAELRRITGRRNGDGTSVFEHYRMAWRDVASATNERSAIAAVLPPGTAAVNSAPTVWGGELDPNDVIELAAIISSFTFDYLVRFSGRTHLNFAAIDRVPTPPRSTLANAAMSIAEIVCRHDEFDVLWEAVQPGRTRPDLDLWEIAERRATIDAEVAVDYGLSLVQFTAVLSSFPNLDRTEPMLPGEPKSFVTRDLALLALCRRLGEDDAKVTELLEGAGVDLPPPRPDLVMLSDRVARARQLGAIPYRPSPKGGRTPTDPELVDAVRELLSDDGTTVTEFAEALEEDARVVKKVLEQLVDDDEAFASGRGKSRRYYVVAEDGG